jgi:S1-C subfamily serine protease
MRNNLLHFAVAAAVVLGGGSLALAGGSKCTEQHASADYQKMAEKMAAKGWLGIDTEKNASGGYTVSAITKGSPAEKAGFQVGDVLVALNGVKLSDDNKDAIYKVKSTLGPGKAVNYTVARAGSEKQINATLAEVPREVLAEWLGEHVLDHTTVAVAASN